MVCLRVVFVRCPFRQSQSFSGTKHFCQMALVGPIFARAGRIFTPHSRCGTNGKTHIECGLCGPDLACDLAMQVEPALFG